MWPWEHVLFAYLVYSVYRHLLSRERPVGPPTIALVVGSLVPDAVDKPLAWEFGITSSGHAIAHSIAFALPACLAAYLLARWAGRTRIGVGFAFGYLLHLIGDVIPISMQRGELYVEHLLWPFVRSVELRGYATVGEAVGYHLGGYVMDLTSSDPSTMVLVQLGLGVGGLVLWMLDRFPGISTSVGAARRTLRWFVRDDP